jgi:hypothetical protein
VRKSGNVHSVKSALRTGAGLASLLLTLFVAGTMTVGARSPGVAEGAASVLTGSTERTARAIEPAAPVEEPALVPPQECAGRPSRMTLFSFPFRPQAGAPVRFVAVSRERLAPFTADVEGRDVRTVLEPTDHWAPGPYAWEFVAPDLAAGDYSVTLRDPRDGGTLGCATLRVWPAGSARERFVAGDAVWPVRREWNGALEDLYSIWVARLFRVPEDFHGGWHRLHAVFRDPARNLLHDALGWQEDEGAAQVAGRPTAIRARADCGDLPYTLRAYFAWKLELPFRFQRCNRGNALVGAECYEERSNLTDRFAGQTDPVERFNRFLETYVASGVHSATPRTLPEDETSDFYPIEMSRTALRPGTVYVWPYGHLLVVTDWQEDVAGGLSLVAVDGHTDGTVTFKRFSPQNFPYLPGLRTTGFKTFRPVVYAQGEIRPVANAAIATYETPLLFSEEQYRFRHSSDFYQAVQQVSALFPALPPGS